MHRIIVIAVALLAGTMAKADDGLLLLQSGETAILDLGAAGQFPVVSAESGMQPADCPDGTFWIEGIGIGSILTECGGGSQYQIIEASDPGFWTLSPWPKPIDDDDAGPRAR